MSRSVLLKIVMKYFTDIVPFLGHRCNITRYRSNSTLEPVGSRSLLLKIEKWFMDDNSSNAS
jgi:hypothetical protein